MTVCPEADVRVIPMEGYTRNMIFQDTGLTWVPTSPNIPDLDSVFGYMSTGLGEGTGIYQADKFKWIGGKGINAQSVAKLLNQSGLPGVTFIPENIGSAGGVRLKIQDYHTFNPARTGIYALAYAHSLNNFQVPKSGTTMVMFDKVMGTNKVGLYLEQGLTPWQIEAQYQPRLNSFKAERQKYLIYEKKPNYSLSVIVRGKAVEFDAEPFINANNRLMVPLRAIVEALGAQVDWNPQKRTVEIKGDGKKILFVINSKSAVVNGVRQSMDTSPVIKKNRTMIPVRYVGEYLGAAVNWNAETRMVTIE